MLASRPGWFYADDLEQVRAWLFEHGCAAKLTINHKAELRKLSVVHVTSSEQRDALSRPLPGGLYDPAMGPTDQYESCKTCGLDYTTCPGHLGHIELALPAYTPVLFPQLVTLLRSTCLLCHRLKADAGKLRILADALRLLDQAYADAGTRGSNVFKKEYLHNGLWRVVLHKDRWLKPADPRRAAAVVAHYKEWLPPWRVPAPAASSSQPTRKRSRS